MLTSSPAAPALDALAEQAPDLLLVIDATGTISVATGACEAVLAMTSSDLQGTPLDALIHPDDLAQAAAFLDDARRAGAEMRLARSWRMRREPDGWAHTDVAAVNLHHDPSVGGVLLSCRDVSAREALDEELRFRALHDPLTQLPNRSLLHERVGSALARPGRSAGLLFVDVDDFKVINDSLGHAVGDGILIAVAARLRGCLRSADTAARFGGDEFAVLLEDAASAEEALAVGERILDALRRPFVVHGEAVRLTVSIGVAVGEGGTIDGFELLRRADYAMYSAKRGGKRRMECFDQTTEQQALERFLPTAPVTDADRITWLARADEERAQIERLLQAPRELIRYVFQPIVDLRTGTVAAYEALSRFEDGQRPPNAWFAQAHRCGFGIELELAAVAGQLTSPDRPEGARLSLNLSPSTLLSAASRQELGGDLSHVTIEVTEDELVLEGTALERRLAELRRQGARLAVDDVGAGYAGLRQVVRLRPDLLKLDRSLVDGVTDDPAKGAMIDALVRYARRIGAEVCAEGIESLDDLRTLADLDVTYGQGYALGRPSPPWEPVDPAAADVCAQAHTAVIAHDAVPAGPPSLELQLEGVCHRIAAATTRADLRALLEPIRDLLSVDEVSLSVLDEAGEALHTVMVDSGEVDEDEYRLEDYPATVALFESREVLQILASDPDADPAERAVVHELGFGACLLVPLYAGTRPLGLLEVYTRAEQPWSRARIHGARIVSYQLGRALAAIIGR